MQKESRTVAKSIFSLMKETKQADSRLGCDNEPPESVLSKRRSIIVGNSILMTAKIEDGINQGINSSQQFPIMWMKQMSKKVSVRAILPIKSSTTCHLLNLSNFGLPKSF